MTERKERKPSAFEDLAKLARDTQPRETTQLSEDEEANSGMINLAALAAGAFASARPSPVASPPERGQRLMDPPEAGAAPSSSPMAPLVAASQPAPAAARSPSPVGALPPPTPPPVVLSPESPEAVTGMTARFPSASVLLHREGVLTPVPLPPPASPPFAAASSPAP
ncbi:MAG: hypothetical protein JOZ69_12515, partial [Myxococcales bacterium]|nr:hypothetical protein [Myxococcales bacterium]